MDKLETIRYIASYKDVYNRSGLCAYEAHKHYYESGHTRDHITFDPLQWLADNIRIVFSDERCKFVYNATRVPTCVVFQDRGIVNKNIPLLENISNVAIKIMFDENCTSECHFDAIGYYSIHHEQIEHFCEYVDERHHGTVQTKALLFYVCYGYHLNITFGQVSYLQYIASYPTLIASFETDIDAAGKHYFNHKHTITFDPVVYVASNISHENIKQFIRCDGSVDENRATKHYIRNGAQLKLKTASFNHWEYLANNPNKIQRLMRKKGSTVEYDVVNVTHRNTAFVFIKKHKKAKHNIFDPVKFVKEYIDDTFINADKKLTIENATERFVKYYVLYETLRYNMSFKHKAVIFLQNMIQDSLRQIPYNATRYIIESRFV